MTGKRPTRPVSRRTGETRRKALPKAAEQIFEVLPDLIFRLDARGVFLEFMGGRQAELYRAPDQFIGKPMEKVLPPEVAEFLIPRIRQVLKSGKPASVDYLLPMEDGPQRYEARLVPSGQGDVLALVRSVTRNRPVETVLSEIEGRYHALVELSPSAIAIHDGRTILYVNRAAADLLVGGERDRAVGRPVADFVHPDSRATVAKRIRSMLRSRRPMPLIQEKFLRADGSAVDVEVTASSFQEENRTLVQVIFRDISRRRADEAAIARLSRLHAFLSAANQALARVSDREELFRQVCRVAVERGGLKAAWVGLVEGDGRRVVPEVSWGETDGYPAAVHIIAGKGRGGRGPTGRALRTGRVALCNDIERDPAMAPWREEALQRGFRSSAAVPFRLGGKAIGTLNLYAAEAAFFGDQEQALLEVLADDLEFALGALEQNALRLQMEGALAESEENFRGLFEHSKDGIFITLPDGHILSFNAAALRMFGYGLGELESLNANRLYADPSDRRRFREAIEREGAVRDFEVRLRRKDGTVFDCILSASLRRGARGETLGYQGIIHDITERKRVERILRENEERFSQVAEVAREWIWEVDAAGIYRYCSPAVEQILGYAPKELVGRKTFFDLFLPELREDMAARALAVFRRKEPFRNFVNKNLRKDGSTVILETSGLPMLDAAGGLLGYRGVDIDVTERRQAKAALRDSEEKYRTLVGSARDAIFIADAETGFIVEVNRQAERLTGLPAADLIGRHQSLLHPPEERDRYRRIFADHSGGDNLLARDLLVRRADGTDVPVDISATIVEIGGRRFIQGVFQDISDRKWAERALQESVEMLQRSMQGTILAMMTMVEMRDPFTAGHQSRVARLACAIGRAMGMNEHQVEGLRVAGLLHDIGKIGVPAEILSKPGRILDFEYNIIKSHSEIGHKILQEIDFPWPIADMVLHHHERLDGSGYPLGLKGGAIMLESRILVVADVVEAMASHRPYRPARGLDLALGEVELNKGILYDPDVVEACLALFKEHNFTLD